MWITLLSSYILLPDTNGMMRVPQPTTVQGEKVTLHRDQPGVALYFEPDKEFKIAFKSLGYGGVSLYLRNKTTNTQIHWPIEGWQEPTVLGPFSSGATYYFCLRPSDGKIPVEAEAIIFAADSEIPEGFRQDSHVKKLRL
jgi:hypothetical protein